MLNNLLAVLLRFKEESLAFIGDISKMFHSIETVEADQMTHRLLWRDLDMKREPDMCHDSCKFWRSPVSSHSHHSPP